MRTGGGRGRSQTSSRPLFPLHGNGGGGDDVCVCVCVTGVHVWIQIKQGEGTRV